MTSRLSLQQANEIIEACLAKSLALKTRPVAVAVLDAGGYLLALQRHEKSANLTSQIAIAKASGAFEMGISSRQLGALAVTSPAFLATVGPLSRAGMVGSAGALLILDEHQDVVGAIAVAGDVPDNDELCAAAGIEAYKKSS